MKYVLNIRKLAVVQAGAVTQAVEGAVQQSDGRGSDELAYVKCSAAAAEMGGTFGVSMIADKRRLFLAGPSSAESTYVHTSHIRSDMPHCLYVHNQILQLVNFNLINTFSRLLLNWFPHPASVADQNFRGLV